MHTSPRIQRRNLLLGLGAGTAFLAPLLRNARARAAGRPATPNLIIFFTPNGFARTDFGTDGNDATFKPRKGFEPTTPMLDHISVVRGLSSKNQYPVNPFHDQIAHLLTGVTGVNASTAGGPTLDQKVAELANKNPINLKVYWSRIADAGTFQKISWKQASFPNRNENDPRKAFAALFAGMAATGQGSAADVAALAEQRAQRKSVLDFLRGDINLLKGRLPSPERVRLDLHLDSLRQAETRIDALSASGLMPNASACSIERARAAETTGPADDSGPYNPAAFKAHGDVQASLLVAAIGCGVRNAGTILWQGASGGINPNGGTGIASDHHELTHDRAPRPLWVDVDRWYSARFAAFLGELRDAGSLDDTAVLWCSETAEHHSHNNCTFVVAGGKNLGIRHRRTVNFPFNGDEGGGLAAARTAGNRSFSDMITTIYRAAGGPGNLGDNVTGPITEIWSATT